MSYKSEFTGNEEIILPINSSKLGYSFGGWYSNSSFTGSPVTSIPVGTKENKTFYAKWNIINYQISYHLNGGILEDYPSTYTVDDVVILPIPALEGHNFIGWYTNSDFTGTSITSILKGSIGNQNLYAKWGLDVGNFRTYMLSIIPNEIENDINLPSTYDELYISWSSDNPSVLDGLGKYTRPYIATTVILTANITSDSATTVQTFEVNVKGYKVLSTGIASSYIYRDYETVTQAFFDTLDIINCAFILADANGNLGGTYAGNLFLNRVSSYIMDRAHAQGDWVILSIGPSSSWVSIALDPVKVNNFANNIVNMINTYGFDGVDIDWEYPNNETESLAFVEMMKTIYQKVKANNPHHLVTAAIGAGMWQPPRYNLINSKQYLDFINMMAYDMSSTNGQYQNALHRRTTYHNPSSLVGMTLTSCSIEESVAFLVNNYSIPLSKIIVGIPFYGVRQMRTNTNGSWSSWVKAGTVYYHDIVANYLNNTNYTEYYDTIAKVPYLLKNDGTEFISYDNPTSVYEKCIYVLDNNLGGIMYWENGCDLTGALLNSLKIGLNK